MWATLRSSICVLSTKAARFPGRHEALAHPRPVSELRVVYFANWGSVSSRPSLNRLAVDWYAPGRCAG
jgi:hypothetical protein